MMSKTSAEAQNQFGQLLDLVQREPVIITRHGRPAAFMFSPRDMEELVSIGQQRSKVLKDRKAQGKPAKNSLTPATAGFTEEDANQTIPKERSQSKKRDLRSR